eukprot:TRINITY_DN2230_c0_g1_i1.p1 TRINITY_DN2230_c0_g1~~TRINITY_DN2230_c0_g1_i1.p1  ORF type:complete len:639 (-),score=255.63 TRINITY_DN2230_c0_g1_i1:201-2117(-)
MHRGLKALLAPPPGFEGAELVADLSGYPCQKQIEQAGEGYEQLILRRSGHLHADPVADSDDVDEEKDAKPMTEEELKFEAKRHKKRLEVSDDPYEILNLGHLRFRATDEDIKQAYRKLVLQYHPDKNEGKEMSDELFKKINKANEDLTDPRKRRIIDSEEDFDDTIPEKATAENFFDVFGPVFERFSKWSTDSKIPMLGNPFTPYPEVQKFYAAWLAFKSWRDFAFEDEFDLNEAESREERRWMHVQNERTRKKMKKQEAATIRKLVETAESFDPRVRKFKQDALDQRNAIKQAKKDAIKQKYEEIERAAAAERERKELEEKARLEELEREKKEKASRANKLRKLRTELRSYCKPPSKFNPPADEVETLCSKGTVEMLSGLTRAFKAMGEVDPVAARAAFDEELANLRRSESDQQQARTAELQRKEAEEQAAAAAACKPWTERELADLAAAIRRWPAGVNDRWQRVAEALGNTRTVKEVIARAKETANTPNKPQVQILDAFDRFSQQKKVPKVEIKAVASTSDESEFVVQQQNASAKAPSTSQPEAVTSPKPAPKAASAAVAPSAVAASPTASTPAAASVEDWTPEQQKLLEKGLQLYPASAEERWEKIAKHVGRTKKDCIARYKFLVQQIKEKKAGA